MQTGYSLNKAKAEFEMVLFLELGTITPQQAKSIGDALIRVLDAAIGIQSHPGSPLTNS